MTISPERILARATELGIHLWADEEKIKYRGPKGMIPSKMVEVIKAHKEALLLYLHAAATVGADKARETLCFACLNEGHETAAHFIGPEDLLYCQTHYDMLPSEVHRADLERLTDAYKKKLPFIQEVHIEPRCTLAERLKQQQTEEAQEQDDYWTRTQQKLSQQDYYSHIARENERLRQQVIPPRVYPAPFPALALVEVDGITRLHTIGTWHPTEDRLLTEQ